MFPRVVGHFIRQQADLGKVSPKVRPAPHPTPCILEARIKVLQANWADFRTKAMTFRGFFHNEGLELRVSGFHAVDQYYELFNYWDLGNDANKFTNIEVRAPDVPEFGAFDALMADEEKELVVPIAGAVSTTIGSDALYLRLESSLESEQLAEFQAELEASPISQWALGDAYVPLTGKEDRMIQVWQIPAKDTATADAVLKAARWYKLLENPKTTLLSATTFGN
jgi:hypothetical protein